MQSTEKPKKKSSSRDQWALLAFARFLLAFCVVMTHSGIVAPDYFFARHFGATGYPAVFGFFMISGYSIAASLASRPEGYVARRLLRIYPTYLCALAFSVAILIPGPLHLPLGQVLVLDNWKTILSNVFMLQGVLTESITSNGAVWSLAVEWWCYMVAIPLIRVSIKWTFILIAGSFTALMIYMRAHGYLFGNSDMPLNGMAMLALSWGWLTGFLFYRRRSMVTFAAMLLLPLIMFEVGFRLPLASVIIAATAAVVYFSKEIRIKCQLIKRVMQWLGNMSYPLYLFHPPLLYVLTSHGIIKNGNVLIVAVVIVVSIGYFIGSRVMDFIIERFGTTNDRDPNPSVSSAT
ncbi:acyltransferase [Paraburkholderia sp. J7]|uniref:acyltransferase family protein n=1 Tax=Paraburkholderia sp. J7 TaxID=2805438 RepID=UPI002AB67752|nr:acyltransferase [Paraburkholderia sp. J7]